MNMYNKRLMLIFVLCKYFSIYNINSICNSCRENKSKDTKNKIHKIIKIPSVSITLDGKELIKLKECEKPENFVDENHKEKTDFYAVEKDAFSKNYKIVIEDNENVPYVIAIVELQDKKGKKAKLYI